MAGLSVEPGLVDLLVSEVSRRPGALPLMSHVLTETWERREGRTLTVAGYRESGGSGARSPRRPKSSTRASAATTSGCCGT